jgi:hypothetical protein
MRSTSPGGEGSEQAGHEVSAGASIKAASGPASTVLPAGLPRVLVEHGAGEGAGVDDGDLAAGGLGDQRVEVRVDLRLREAAVEGDLGVGDPGVVLEEILADAAELLHGALGERPKGPPVGGQGLVLGREAHEGDLARPLQRAHGDERGRLLAAPGEGHHRARQGTEGDRGSERPDRAPRAPSSLGARGLNRAHFDSRGGSGVPTAATMVPKVSGCLMSRSTTPRYESVKCAT